MAKIKRPMQGNNSTRPFNRPRPAYKAQAGPTVVSSGSVSKPKDTKWKGSSLKRLPADATPKVIQL
jgi:hypothetical protein